jgi:hypothetical protein
LACSAPRLAWRWRTASPPGGRGIDVTAVSRPETHKLLTPDQLRTVQEALGRSLRAVFLQMLAIGCSIGLRGGRAVSHGQAEAPPSDVDEAITLAVGADQAR